jgi:hypothetical protein
MSSTFRPSLTDRNIGSVVTRNGKIIGVILDNGSSLEGFANAAMQYNNETGECRLMLEFTGKFRLVGEGLMPDKPGEPVHSPVLDKLDDNGRPIARHIGR